LLTFVGHPVRPAPKETLVTSCL